MTTCPRCDGELIKIDISHNTLTFTMQSCARCDTRSWAVDGSPSQLPAVLRSLADDGIPVEATAI